MFDPMNLIKPSLISVSFVSPIGQVFLVAGIYHVWPNRLMVFLENSARRSSWSRYWVYGKGLLGFDILAVNDDRVLQLHYTIAFSVTLFLLEDQTLGLWICQIAQAIPSISRRSSWLSSWMWIVSWYGGAPTRWVRVSFMIYAYWWSQPMLGKMRWCIGLGFGIVVDALLWRNHIICEKEVVDRRGSMRCFNSKACVLLLGLY